MQRIGFTVKQDGRHIGSTPIMEQAINAAKSRAAETGRDVSVVASYTDAADRENVYHPDGTVTKTWREERS